MYLDLFLSFLFTFIYLSSLTPVSYGFKCYSFILCFNYDLYFESLRFPQVLSRGVLEDRGAQDVSGTVLIVTAMAIASMNSDHIGH